MGVFLQKYVVLNFLVEGICTEDAECNLRGDKEILECNLRGDKEILMLFEKLLEFCYKAIPSREQRYSYRF